MSGKVGFSASRWFEPQSAYRARQGVLDLAIRLVKEAAVVALLDDDEHELRPVVLAADGEARAADGSDLGSRDRTWA